LESGKEAFIFDFCNGLGHKKASPVLNSPRTNWRDLK